MSQTELILLYIHLALPWGFRISVVDTTVCSGTDARRPGAFLNLYFFPHSSPITKSGYSHSPKYCSNLSPLFHPVTTALTEALIRLYLDNNLQPVISWLHPFSTRLLWRRELKMQPVTVLLKKQMLPSQRWYTQLRDLAPYSTIFTDKRAPQPH